MELQVHRVKGKQDAKTYFLESDMTDEPDWVKRSRMHRKIHAVLGWILISGFVFGIVYKLVVLLKDVVK